MQDSEALDRIANLLRAPEWRGADFLEAIGEWVAATGRSLDDVTKVEYCQLQDCPGYGTALVNGICVADACEEDTPDVDIDPDWAHVGGLVEHARQYLLNDRSPSNAELLTLSGIEQEIASGNPFLTPDEAVYAVTDILRHHI